MPGNLASSIPPSVLASWPTPNYVDPVRRSWYPAFAIVITCVATVMFAGRLFVRSRAKGAGLGLDDAFLIAGWLLYVPWTAIGILATMRYGMDRHLWDVPPTLWWQLMRLLFAGEILYFACSCLIKISVLLLYRRLVQNADGPMKNLSYASIAGVIFVAAYGVAFILTLIFNCTPLEAYWKAYDLTYTGHYTCVNTRALNWVSGVLSVVTDLYSVILPCVVLRHIQAHRRQKVALNILFCLSLLICGAGAARTYYQETLPEHYDTTWYSFYVYLTAQLEIALAIMCASAPSFRVLIQSYLVDPFSSVFSSRSTRRFSTSTAITPLSGSKLGHDSEIKLAVLPSCSSVNDIEADLRGEPECR